MADTADRVVRFLIANACCTECDASYHLEDVHVLNQIRGRVWDLAAVCHVCLTLSIVRAVVRTPPDLGHAHQAPSADHPGAESAESAQVSGLDGSRGRIPVSLHEMTAAERSHFGSLPPIDVDDVLDVTAFLEDFNGDFRCLFSREPEDA